MRARALKWVRFQQCRWASLGGRRPGGEGVGERGVPRNPAEAEAHRVGGSAGGEAWRRGESDAAQPAAGVGRDRARSHLARGGGRCQRGPGGLGPGAARGCRCRFDTRGGVDKLPFILFSRHDTTLGQQGGGLPTLRGGCRLYEGAALRVGHDRGAVKVRDFRRATMRSVEEFYENEKNATTGAGYATSALRGNTWRQCMRLTQTTRGRRALSKNQIVAGTLPM